MQAASGLVTLFSRYDELLGLCEFWGAQDVCGGVFWGVCELSMILGSLSANGWGCVPVLLVVWHGVSSTGAFLAIGWSWVLTLRRRSLGELSPIDILWGVRRSLVVQCPELGSPTSEAQGWHLAVDQDPVSHMALKKREKKRKKIKIKIKKIKNKKLLP